KTHKTKYKGEYMKKNIMESTNKSTNEPKNEMCDEEVDDAMVKNARQLEALIGVYRRVEMAEELFSLKTDFVTSCTSIATLPYPSIPEVCFIGRSNVGKSSLINALVRNKKLVKTSKTPVCKNVLTF